MVQKMRRWFPILAAAALAAIAGGCAEGTQEEAKGSRSNPYMAGEPASYEGYGRQGKYTLEYELVDTQRGSTVNEMLYRASGLDIEESGLLEGGKELLVIRMDIRAIGSKDDQAISFQEDGSPRFCLVSADGIVYEDGLYAYFDDFYQQDTTLWDLYQYEEWDEDQSIKSNPVEREPADMYPGASQMLNLFYLVDGKDKRPVLGVGTATGGDTWFMGSLFERERGEERIRVEDWKSGDAWEGYPWWSGFGINPSDTYEEDYDDWVANQEYGYDYQFKVPIDEEGSYGGTLEAPLPVGAVGLYVDRSASNAWAVECQVVECLRGDEALAYREAQDVDQGSFYLGGGNELVAVRLRVNYLESKNGDTLSFDSSYFSLYSNDVEDSFRSLNLGLDPAYGELYAPGTCEFVLYYEVPKDKADLSLMFHDGYEDGYLYYNLSPSASLPQGVEKYGSVYQPPEVNRDFAMPDGSRQNPVDYQTEYDFSEEEYYFNYYEGTMSILESCRGEAAKAYIDLSKAPALAEGEEYFAVKVRAAGRRRTYSEYDYTDFLLVGRDNWATGTGRVPEEAMKEGTDGDGAFWVGFRVKDTAEDLLIGYCYYQPVWFEVQAGADKTYPTV